MSERQPTTTGGAVSTAKLINFNVDDEIWEAGNKYGMTEGAKRTDYSLSGSIHQSV